MKTIIYVILAISVIACSSKNEVGQSDTNYASTVQKLPQTIIYKTKQDYSQFVPVQMDKERTKIVGYPSPQDLEKSGELQTPIILNKGFFLDRRGINANTVFIKVTYAEYAKMQKAPAISDMMEQIVDKYPFVEMYTCPDLKQNAGVDELNKVVSGGFTNCVRIKFDY